MQLSYSWISLAITYLSAFFPYSCSIRWRWQCQLVPQKTRWQSTHIRSCLFLQDVKERVPSACSLYSAVWQPLLILRAFLLSHLIFSFYNKDNSSSTDAVLWQAALLKVPGTEPSPEKLESWCLRKMWSSYTPLEVPLHELCLFSLRRWRTYISRRL